ncbi:MAG: hypothetical protein U0556_10230 [Dehalococcoidia bacterium]
MYIRPFALAAAFALVVVWPQASHAATRVSQTKPAAVQVGAVEPTYVDIVSVVGARPWGSARVSAGTEPFAFCEIAYVTPAGTPSTARGLYPKRADRDGLVSWVWTIGSSTRPGTGMVYVYCGDGMDAKPITISR